MRSLAGAFWRRRGLLLLGALLALAITGCESGGGAGASPDPVVAGDGASGVDLSGYSSQGSVGTGGGSVSIAGGPSVEVLPGTVASGTVIALRPAAAPPATPSGWTGASDWYDMATNRADIAPEEGGGLSLAVPITPPAGSEDHPGLQLLVVMPGGLTVPVDGVFDEGSGTFKADLLGLPPEFSFRVAFNPDIQRVESYVLPSESPHKVGAAGGWSTVDWAIDFDSKVITLEEAKSVVKWGRKAAQIYSDAGFKEPFLFKDTWATIERWHVHLIATGSNYDSNHNDNDVDLARRFGRLNLAVDDLRQPITGLYGGGYSILAHEMFHSIFENYAIPSICFDLIENNIKYCYRSHSGFNEGIATAVAYSLEQGSPKPRMDLDPMPLERSFGYFDPANMGAAYQNQDFTIYLLRMGSLETIRSLLEALATASMAGANSRSSTLLAYAEAMDTAQWDIPDPASRVFQLFCADHGYLRSTAGNIWPNEPNDSEPGKSYMWSPMLFPNGHLVTADDCQSTNDATFCMVELKGFDPMSARGILLDMNPEGELPPDINMANLTMKVEASGAGDQMAMWIFGEQYLEGSSDAVVSDMSGKEVTLKEVTSKWTTAKVLLAQGAGARRDVKVKLTLGVEDLSGACDEASDWMCKCQSAGTGYGCSVYDIAVQQMCANVESGYTCEQECADLVTAYEQAWNDVDPEIWNAMCYGNPK